MHPLLKLSSLFRPHKRQIVLCQIALLLGVGLNLIGPVLLAYAIDENIPAGDGRGLLITGALFSLVLITNIALTLWARIGAEKVAQSALVDLKKELYDHLLDHDLSFHDQHTSGQLITRIQGDASSMRVLFTEVIFHLPADLVTLIGMFAIITIKAPNIAILVFWVIPIYIVAFLLFGKYSPPFFMRVRTVTSKLTGFLSEYVRAIPTLRSFGRIGWAIDQVEKMNLEVFKRQSAAFLIPPLYFNTLFFVRALGFSGVLYFGALSVESGEVSIGSLVLGLGYLRLMFSPLMRLSFHQSTVERAKASAIRIAGLLDDHPSVVDCDSPSQFLALTKAIDVENVSFSYDSDALVLKNISLSIKAGSNVGIVGATGSGKSSLLNLLLRFRDPKQGQIVFDGVPLKEISIASLRGSTGLVHQDVLLFPGTVLDNLGGDRVLAQRALDLLGLDLSLDSNLSLGGQNLSRGERQLITFARAIVGDPSLLILDEATSAIDPATEERIQEALGAILEGRTTVTVAHRLSTVRGCDNIFLMSQGVIEESGNHDDLLKKGGEYAKLWELQEGAIS